MGDSAKQREMEREIELYEGYREAMKLLQAIIDGGVKTYNEVIKELATELREAE